MAITVIAALTLAGCSGAADTSGPAETLVEITIEGDSIEPNGDQVRVPLGEPITLAITSDRDGELHVHSTPEQEVGFADGDTEVELTFDRAGVVEVEDHESGKVIVELEVS